MQRDRHPLQLDLLCNDEGVAMVLPVLGPDMATLLRDLNGKFSVKTTLMIALLMIQRLTHIHKKGYLHNDVKIQNITISRKDPTNIYLIDFGIAEKILIDDDGIKEKNKSKDGKEILVEGTVDYLSVSR